MSNIDIVLLILYSPFILGFLYLLVIAFIAIFFYKDSETDKVQIEYLIEKEKEENRKRWRDE